MLKFILYPTHMLYALWAAFVALIVIYVFIKKGQKKDSGAPAQGQ